MTFLKSNTLVYWNTGQKQQNSYIKLHYFFHNFWILKNLLDKNIPFRKQKQNHKSFINSYL